MKNTSYRPKSSVTDIINVIITAIMLLLSLTQKVPPPEPTSPTGQVQQDDGKPCQTGDEGDVETCDPPSGMKSGPVVPLPKGDKLVPRN